MTKRGSERSTPFDAINVGEVLYATWKRKGEAEAKRRIQQTVASPISTLVTADPDFKNLSDKVKTICHPQP